MGFQGVVGRKVLVTDDSWTQRANAVAVVRSLGAAEVFEAADGVEALAVLEVETGIDLVLCDLEMPRMDGVALIGEIAARGLNPDLLILSSMEGGILESVKHMALSYGLMSSAVLPKPVSKEQLIAVLSAPPFAGKTFAAGAAGLAPGALTLGEIRAGMQNREFECHYQPQVAMQGGHMKGVEALVRWRHPELGLLRPGLFLPQMEEDTETMSDLTLRILQEVAVKRAEWHQSGVDPDISVNLSATSLNTAGFADRIFEMAEQQGLDPRKMILEVTESASISNLGHTLSNLARLRIRGFRLSIDDFGTGYATYEQLEKIPFTELKIDMSITKQLPTSRKHLILAKSLLQLAQDLRLDTVAEGIETKESWAVLKASGCNCGQGYFLARPMPGGQIPAWTLQDRTFL
jgi:EAL domain-containing protein (putative c-di-GMP-specific phosphodiesterase class I)